VGPTRLPAASRVELTPGVASLVATLIRSRANVKRAG
jgi:hypothetical protein